MKTSELLKKYAEELGWEVANFGYSCAQRGFWLVNGTYWKIFQGRRQIKQSAQVLNIHGRFKYDEYLAPAKRSDFILTHERFEDPEYVLQDHVTLYAINKKEAIFIEAPEGYELWRAKYSPFIMNAQFHHAKKVIIMPIRTFHHLADKRGPPNNVAFFSNTARCGSTLVTQMFEATGQIVSISEPSALNVLARYSESLKKEDPELEKLVISTVRMLCKPTKNQEVGYVLKLTAPALPLIGQLSRLHPQSACLFMYRDAIKVAQSIYRLSEELPAIKTLYALGGGNGRWIAFLFSQMGMASDFIKPLSLWHNFTKGLGFNHMCHLVYNNLRKEGLNISAVRYEDIIEDPTGSMKTILEYCKMPTDRVHLCKEALKEDSQKGTPLSGEVLYRHPTVKYEGAAKIECDKMCEWMKLPKADEPLIAPGTITYKGPHPNGTVSHGGSEFSVVQESDEVPAANATQGQSGARKAKGVHASTGVHGSTGSYM